MTLELEHFLPYRLNRLADQMSRQLARIYRDQYGLGRPEWRVLATLGQYGVMTASDIAAHSAMHKTKVSRAIAKLERRRWLTRDRDPNDRRFENITLSAGGRAAYDDLIPLMLANQQKLNAQLGPEAAANLDTGLRALEQAFSEAD